MTIIEGHRQFEPHSSIAVLDVDPYDDGILTAPHSYWRDLRAAGEVVYIPRYGVLAVGRYDTTRITFSDHERFVSSRGVGLLDFTIGKPWRPPSIILEVDPPDHTRTRTIMARVLSPKVVKGLEEMFRETAERLVDEALDKGEIDGVTELAELFPTSVFPRAVGMTEVDVRNLVDYGAMAFNALGPDNAIRRAALERAPEVVDWITSACARERLDGAGLGALVYRAADEGLIRADEAAMLVRSFLSAGVDTTVTGIGNALWCFSRNCGEWDRLRADPGQSRAAFEEVLRYTSPVHTFARTANVDTEIAGHPVREGTKILCALGSANMDPDKWGDPEVFRIDRRPTGHLAFGAGIHGCVGQVLARGELEAVLSVMARRVRRIEPAGEAIWRPNNAIHALASLPLRLVPA